MMLDGSLPLLGLAFLIWFWLDTMRARERARSLSHRLCQSAGLQLLDQTVALQHLRIRRDQDGRLGLLRSYSFEVSSDGSDRHRGSLSLLRGSLQAYLLPLSHDAADAFSPAQLH